MSKRLTTSLSIFIATNLLVALPAIAEFEEKDRGVSAEMKIMVPPEVTYAAAKASRDESDEDCKIISSTAAACVIEELFDGLPVIGNAKCLYRESYEPLKISYKMISSDKLKAFEGEWTFTPADDGQSTIVKLRSYIDTGLRIPFARKLTDMGTSSEVKQHLSELKKSAETRFKRIAKTRNQST